MTALKIAIGTLRSNTKAANCVWVANTHFSRADWKQTRMSFLAELWAFMRHRKKYWLLPILIMMGIFGGLIVLTQGSAVAPFIYTIF